MKIYPKALLSFIVFFVVGILCRSHIGKFFNATQSSLPDNPFRIAILVPATHPALEDIRQGFIETLNKSIPCIYDDYNAHGNRTLMRSQAEEVVSKQYDLIFTIATAPALILKEVCEQRNSAIPVVAGAVDDPVGLKLIASMETSKNNITAVTSTDSFDEQIALLKFLKPTCQSILLVYNPTSGLDRKKQIVQEICQKQGITFKVVEIYSLNDISQKVPAVLNHCDTILVLKDNLVVSGIESLINICNHQHKTLYVSDLNSGDKGAALSYGVYEYADGVEAALKAYKILKFAQCPCDIPTTVCNDFKIKVNTATMKDQDLHIEKQLLQVIKSGEIV